MNPETLYNHYSNAIIGAVGKDATTAQQLNTLGDALMPGFYRGAHPRGQEPVDDNTKHVYVVNGMTGPPGDHWHAVLREPGKKPLIYDSFGRGTRGFVGRGTERDAEQKKTGSDKNTCGQRCLAWGLTAKLVGQDADQI
jgi:hypothetical protein